jgi:hypothetical protein
METKGEAAGREDQIDKPVEGEAAEPTAPAAWRIAASSARRCF